MVLGPKGILLSEEGNNGMRTTGSYLSSVWKKKKEKSCRKTGLSLKETVLGKVSHARKK